MQKDSNKITIALVDDHTLFRKGLSGLIEMVDENIDILFEADNGVDLQKKLDPENLPDIILMDINMPVMDGFESVVWLNKNHPEIKVLIVSMVENEESIIKMLKLKVKGYLSKDVEPAELGAALNAIMSKGFYYTDFITGKLVHTLQSEHERESLVALNEKERKFIQLACSELTYNDIAGEMFVSPKTIDGYRNNLFEKLAVKSRVGLALYAVKHGLVKL
ncbi:MAG: response regulator transcription factor [Sphingobacteriales bacterium]|nr:MAG: response regulator transcription factor [Sphingobacteriales bacterium]